MNPHLQAVTSRFLDDLLDCFLFTARRFSLINGRVPETEAVPHGLT